MEYFEKDAQLTKELYTSYPENVSFKNGLAISYIKLGLIYEEKKESEKSKNWYKKAQTIWNEMVKAYPNYVEFKKNLDWVNKKLT